MKQKTMDFFKDYITEIVSQASDGKATMFLTATKTRATLKEDTKILSYNFSLIKSNKTLNLRKDGDIVLSLQDLKNLRQVDRDVETGKMQVPFKFHLPCSCGCSFLLIIYEDDKVFIERYVHGNINNLTRKNTSEIVLDKSEYSRFLREVQIYILNEKIE